MTNIAQNLLQRARTHPNATAINSGEATLTFAQLAHRARCLAGAMRTDLGLNPGDRVALWMENRGEFFELLFACWCAGLCAVPINAKLHPKELAHIVGDSSARAVFTSEFLIETLTDEFATQNRAFLYVVGSSSYQRLTQASALDCADAAPDDLAWLFYTSGTTGKPKGAMLTHRNLTFMALAYFADIERVAPGDTMLHAAPLSHGSGLYALPHLFAGGTQLVLQGFDPRQVLDAFEHHNNVSLFAAPTMVTRLVQAAGASTPASTLTTKQASALTATQTSGLRTVIYGGGPMYVSDLIKALDHFGPKFYQLFGQGESPMTITGLSQEEHLGEQTPEHLARLGSCGTARMGVEIRVVDENGRELPVGELGEVITRSDCVMAGYWNNPSATASALRDGWLWTGDMGMIDAAGYLTLRDRSKDMIISGGSNIYPREIEEVLLRHPAVLECSVIGREHPDWGEEVVAFIVPRAGTRPTVAELDALCLSNIARFKRPKEYRFVDALPKNNYGKILKTRLRTILQTRENSA